MDGSYDLCGGINVHSFEFVLFSVYSRNCNHHRGVPNVYRSWFIEYMRSELSGSRIRNPPTSRRKYCGVRFRL